MRRLETLQKNIGVNFKNITLLQTAFTHRSYINEHPDESREHNERLEFLGDAVLELVVTSFLFEKFPNKNEGDLTSYRSALVNTSTLSTVATGLGFNEYLSLSKGEAKDTGRARQYILANTFEAFVGSLYMDQGYDVACEFISENIFPLTDEIVEKGLWQDSKSKLQEIAQEKLSVTPHYKVVHTDGPDHDMDFTVAVFFGSEEISQGAGRSKQEAQQEAASKALDNKGW